MIKKEFEMLKEVEELRHNNKMIEIQAEEKSRLKVERFKHDLELERQRIKSAEIRRNLKRY